MDAIYNHLCPDYDITRKADPEVTQALLQLLQPEAGGHYVDVACGTGNYTVALHAACSANEKRNCYWYGFDQSATMLAQARAKSPGIEWSLFDVNQTQYPNQIFDGATCILAVHHFQDLTTAFAEIRRILKPGAHLVIFTSTPEQMAHYWLSHYFPTMMQKSCEQMQSLKQLRAILEENRFSVEQTKEFFITPELQDFFLYSGKQRPEMYLSPEVRSGISSFANFATDGELDAGLNKLTGDITSGAIRSLIEKANNYSDYLFISAQRL